MMVGQTHFYDSVVDASRVQSLLMTFKNPEEYQEATSLVQKSLDLAVLTHVLQSLPKELLSEFQILLETSHQDPNLLSWLETKQPGTSATLHQVTSDAVTAIEQALVQYPL
jgi:hypothetical protein